MEEGCVVNQDRGTCIISTVIWERGEPQRGHPPPIPLPLDPYHWHCRHPPLCPAKPCHGQQLLSEAGWVSRQPRTQAPRQGRPLGTTVKTPLSGHNQGHLLRAPVPRPLWSLRTLHIFVLCFRTISIKVAELMHTKIHFLNKNKITIFIDVHTDGWECVRIYEEYVFVYSSKGHMPHHSSGLSPSALLRDRIVLIYHKHVLCF